MQGRNRARFFKVTMAALRRGSKRGRVGQLGGRRRGLQCYWTQ